jgi:ligand-binding sensor domain-containing protein
VVRIDPLDPNRLLAGTTGGVFESRDRGRTFRRISPDVVVNALVFDPRRPATLLIGTEAEGVLLSTDGGTTVAESNRGLAEARVSSVALTSSGRVVVARAADGASGGLWTLNAVTGTTERLTPAPPSTILALAAAGERLFAGTPDGMFLADAPGAAWTKVLPTATRGFAGDGNGRLLAATDAGVFEAKSAGGPWERLGTLAARVDGIRRARFPTANLKTFAADSGGVTLWWDGNDWARRSVSGGPILSGGFGRPAVRPSWVPEPVGLDVDMARSVLVFRPEDETEEGVAITMPESGLSVAGWAGDPRAKGGLYLATMGRGLFRFVPGGL